MPNDSISPNELVSSIRTAFSPPATPPPSLLRIEVADVQQAGSVLQLMAGRPWDAVEFSSNTWLLMEVVWFERDAFLYYLPGMLIAAVESEDPDNLCVLPFFMMELPDQMKMEPRIFYSSLTKDQRAAISQYLRYLDDMDVCVEAQTARAHSFWLQSLDAL